MSNVIGFLEEMGRDAQKRYASSNEMENVLAISGIEPSLQAAILGADKGKLEAVLGAGTNVCCVLAPGKEDNEDDRESPARDDDEIRALSKLAA